MTPERLCWFQTGSNDSAFTCVSTARRSRATGPLHGRATNCAAPTAPQLRLAKFPFPVPPLLLSLSHHPGDALQGGKKKSVQVVFLYIFPPFFFPKSLFQSPPRAGARRLGTRASSAAPSCSPRGLPGQGRAFSPEALPASPLPSPGPGLAGLRGNDNGGASSPSKEREGCRKPGARCSPGHLLFFLRGSNPD